MIFNVAQLMKEPVGAVRHQEVSEERPEIGEGIAATKPVQGAVKLTRTNSGILVDAQLRTAVLLECSRCLTELALPLDVRFREEFMPVIDVGTGLPLPPPEDRSAFTIDEHHNLDITEAFRQFALLALPLAPLCDAACAGLCPVCGRNRNLGPCQCKVDTSDPRWHALGQFWKAANAEGEKQRRRHKR